MDQNAVPDFALSATNLDFPLYYTIVGGRYQVNANLELGLSYGHFFLQKREVTHSAWDVRDTDSEDYIDDHFSPKSPYVASNNGTYKAHTDTIGIRVAAHFGRTEDDE
jgi:hypothetical protein